MASDDPLAQAMAATALRARTLNINVGILGHVDSGKTSLSRALSTMASTNAFDKNPQSKERGITLDLGFSSFVTSLPPQLNGSVLDQMQVRCSHVNNWSVPALRHTGLQTAGEQQLTY
jgi:selenocysteine-specific elongation factor